MIQYKNIFQLICLVWALVLSPSVLAQEICPQSLGSMPILSGGRVKPLAVHASETIKFITGKSRYQKQSPTHTFCKLSLNFLNLEQIKTPELPLLVDHIETRRFLKIPEDQKQIPLSLAQAKQSEMEHYAQVLEESGEETAISKDLIKVMVRAQIYQSILKGENWQVPFFYHDTSAKDAKEKFEWVSLKQISQKADYDSPQSLMSALTSFGEQYQKTVNTKHLSEFTYHKLRLFDWAMIAVLLSLIFGGICKKLTHPAVLLSLLLTYLLEIGGIGFRVFISGRGPVTNMYETVLWVGIGGLFFATVLAFLKKEKIFLLVGLSLNLACLFMMKFASGMLDPSIKPLEPVLRDNFWLSTHVTTITISYAVFALSWILANYYLLRTLLRGPEEKLGRRLNQLCYTCLKIGVVLLAAGTILGGIWADYSWGRFWGWDPKETWALITLMIYMAILHGRYAGWVGPKLFMPLVAFAFLSVLMTWFGVNYILATGLHSYGFSEGGSLFLLVLFLTQGGILISHGLAKFGRRTLG